MNAQPATLRLPPFGRALAAALRAADYAGRIGASADGSAASIFVVCGSHAWVIAMDARDRALLLVAPRGEDPAQYHWDLLAGHDPVIIYRAGVITEAEVLRLVEVLLSDGISRVIDLGTGAHHVQGGAV